MPTTRVELTDCICPSFYGLHADMKNDLYTEYWARGGRGSTKSSWASIEVVLGIVNDPEANAVVFRRFENEIRDSVFGQVEWAINKLGMDHLFKSYVAPFRIVYLPTKQKIIFKGADQPKKIKSIKLAKGYLKFAWFEEVDQFGGMDEIRNLLQSILRGTMKKQVAIFTYNPPKSARSWTNAETKIHKPGRKVHSSDYRSVPIEWLGTTFIEQALHLKEINESAYKHEYLGEEVGTGLEVFDNVTIRPISDKEIAYFDNYRQGLDFGYAIDPMVFLQIHFDVKYKKLYIFFELSGTKISNRRFSHMLSYDQKTEPTFADSAEPKSIDELKYDLDVDVRGVEKAPGSVDFGVKYLQGLEEIIIDSKRCPLTAHEYINYALDVDRQGEPISRYPDKGNHSIDATRYAMYDIILEARRNSRKPRQERPIPSINKWAPPGPKVRVGA